MTFLDYKRVAPDHSYINVFDFDGPKDLAEYLLYLDKNDVRNIKFMFNKIKTFYVGRINIWSTFIGNLIIMDITGISKHLPHFEYTTLIRKRDFNSFLGQTPYVNYVPNFTTQI